MPESGAKTKEKQVPVADHLQDAHSLLKSLQERIGHHPELAQAITELEMALSILTVKTGAML
jgi:hypothetical protein